METTTTVEWEQSDSFAELFGALAKAQGEIESASKDKKNPHFNSRYADLASVWDACRAPLSKHGLCVVQQPFTRGALCGVRTVIGHASGQWMACIATTTPRDQGPQAYGSCVTYLRRYSLAAVAGVAPDDDDGEAAQGRDKEAKPPGASWGRPKAVPTPKAPSPATPGAKSTTASTPGSAGGTKTPASTGTSDTGEVLDPGQLADLTEAFQDKWGKSATRTAPSWLKAKFGTEDVGSLTKTQALEALLLLQGNAA